MADAIDIIHRDHINLSKVLTVMEGLAERLATGKAGEKDLNLLHSIVYYVRLYPDRHHHPLEEKALFTALPRESAEARDLITELEAQHAKGGVLIAALDDALKTYEKKRGTPGALVAAIHDYAVFQRAHMDVEELNLLPLARKLLPREAWTGITQAFAAHADPLFGENIDTGFRALFDHITQRQAAAG